MRQPLQYMAQPRIRLLAVELGCLDEQGSLRLQIMRVQNRV